ncbi:MAG: hypothetical protein HC875_09065 [Anaerolineales bacterium]|nr:hypothetical protein [Anaerolineales bacterium]
MAVVLIASRQALPGDVATPLTGAGTTATANPESASSAEAALPAQPRPLPPHNRPATVFRQVTP